MLRCMRDIYGIQMLSHTVLLACSNVRSELTQLKSSEASIQATAEEVQQQLQQKDSMIEALRAKLAELERYEHDVMVHRLDLLHLVACLHILVFGAYFKSF